MNGLLIVNKSLYYTSMDVIRILRKLTGVKKIGHAGTLDPLATGVLLVCIGKEATKKIDQFMNMEKEYTAEINLSSFSETDDSEGPLINVGVKVAPSLDEINNCLRKFVGEIEQVPPKYSAIKVNGKSAYKRARQGEHVQLKSRTVFIKKIELLSYEWPLLKVQVVCGKGVYIRSLARNIGECLQTGGYVKSLIRTRIGQFNLLQAIGLEVLAKNPELIKEEIQKRVIQVI